MTVSEHVPLASLTTFKVGGLARFVAKCESVEDIQSALSLARESALPWYVLGSGSNLVAPDKGYEGVILRIRIPGLSYEEPDEEGRVATTVGAGVIWDLLVSACVERGLWSIENLAGIPGTVGAAPIQNIGAYGAELADTLLWVEVFDTTSGATRRFAKDECGFGYRESRFKHDPTLIVVRVAFTLTTKGTPHVAYADITKRVEEGASIETSKDIAALVRDIRSKKFPDLRIAGTAGSFFKNPFITKKAYAELLEKYPELPGFPTGESDSDLVKIPLAWILDHVLHLRGFALGLVALYKAQPLVLVSEPGATAYDINHLATEIERMVLESTGITLEREVRFL
jgi:UDP-N-acetylmuramate dehydrogenase